MKNLVLFLILSHLAGQLVFASETGDWQVNGLLLPSRLRESFYNQATTQTRLGENSFDYAGSDEELVDTFFPATGEILKLGVTLTNGDITGDETGTYTIGAQGRVLLDLPDDSDLRAYTNLAQDTWIIPAIDANSMEFNIGTRKPESLAVADLEGAWTIASLSLSSDLVENYAPLSGGDTRVAPASTNFAAEDETLADLFFPEMPALKTYSISINSSGSISGDSTGNASVDDTAKTVSLDIDGNGALEFSTNAGINLLARAQTNPVPEGHPDAVELILGLKEKANPSLADLAGIWRWQSFEIPARLIKNFYNTDTDSFRETLNSQEVAQTNEILVDTYFSTELNTDNGLISINQGGVVTGSDPGSIAIEGGSIVYTPATPDPDEGPLTLYLNETGEILLATEVEEDYLTLLTLVKVESEAVNSLDALVDVKIDVDPSGKPSLNWNESTKFRLLKSTDLGGTWEVISETTDRGDFQDSETGATSGFYRIEVIAD
ncbi:MAG: hypothetical protein ACLFU4_01155 [Opitutales bacterium]